MGKDFIKAVLERQAGLDDCREAMNEALRGIMVQALLNKFNVEMTTLCGDHYHTAPGAARWRACSALGLFWLNGKEERFARPRGRQKQGQKTHLKTYAVPDHLT